MVRKNIPLGSTTMRVNTKYAVGRPYLIIPATRIAIHIIAYRDALDIVVCPVRKPGRVRIRRGRKVLQQSLRLGGKHGRWDHIARKGLTGKWVVQLGSLAEERAEISLCHRGRREIILCQSAAERTVERRREEKEDL